FKVNIGDFILPCFTISACIRIKIQQFTSNLCIGTVYVATKTNIEEKKKKGFFQTKKFFEGNGDIRRKNIFSEQPICHN
ncbi:hypothetical protein N9U70_01550, partial [Paracoccaceae bacterium]|nr:hypothetical protein [Paracoccaceae bacterium]